MDATDITFFATVATVIPVLLVAYVVGVKDTLAGFRESQSESSRQYLQRSLDALQRTDGKLQSIRRATWELAKASAYEIAGIFLFIVSVGMPAAAQYASLHALYVGHAASSSKTVCLIGALLAGAIVVAPLALRLLVIYNPFGNFKGLVLLLLALVRLPINVSEPPSDAPDEKQ